MKLYKVCVVGIGTVGTEMVYLLRKREFPMSSLTVLARNERTEVVYGEEVSVRETSIEAFRGMDFAFFAGTEGEKGASQTFGWQAVARGCTVIDNGDDFRMDSRVPLVIPEINPEALKGHSGFIANPNCSTIIALMALVPLHAVAKIKRVVACTYQAVSGTGAAAMKELETEASTWAHGQTVMGGVYPHQIVFNVIPSVGSFKDDSGESTEEQKMRREIHKILDDNSIGVMATCVRVPVFNGHSIALHVEFERKILLEEARKVLSSAPGVRVVDDPGENVYPMPIHASGHNNVLVGRIRYDPSVPNGLALWCSGDNIWKGAALNAIQIAELIIKK